MVQKSAELSFKHQRVVNILTTLKILSGSVY